MTVYGVHMHMCDTYKNIKSNILELVFCVNKVFSLKTEIVIVNKKLVSNIPFVNNFAPSFCKSMLNPYHHYQETC